MPQLTPEQRYHQAQADALGRDYLTRIDGRMAVIFREVSAETMARIRDVASDDYDIEQRTDTSGT